MPPARFALFPFYINSQKSHLAEFHANKSHEPDELISASSGHITIHAPGTFLIYYSAISKAEDICTALFLNSHEVKATRDCSITPCGGAVVFLTDTVKSAALSLRLCNKSAASARGFIVISTI